MAASRSLPALLKEIRACRLCEASLPLGPRPVLRASTTARILVVGQAPGTAVHASGVPFDDPSGERLRRWMAVDETTFYDASRIAIVPMGFCYPGRGTSGDLPPMKRCAEQWRERLLAQLEAVELTLALGRYAVSWHLPRARGSLTKIVRGHYAGTGAVLPMPHPSPRNNLWLAKNPWFEGEFVPRLQQRIKALLL